MQFDRVVRARRMVRAYRPDPVDPAVVERILDIARRAPSAGFSQGQSFVVVTDPAIRADVAAACGEEAYLRLGFAPWISRAPVQVVPCIRKGDYEERYAEPDKAGSLKPAEWPVPFWWVDAGCSLMLLLLAAVDEGLGAGLLAADSGRLRVVLGIPADVDPVGVITIGRPAPDRRSGSLDRGRKPWEQVVHRDRWSG
jgi:nitroreductase